MEHKDYYILGKEQNKILGTYIMGEILYLLI